jgi:hypothetical protein
MEDSENDFEIVETRLRNIDPSGRRERSIRAESTLCFVTQLEALELLIRRKKQLENLTGKYNQIDPRIINKVGKNASILVLMLAEILDREVEYPLLIKRGDKFLRLHKDLLVIPAIVDIVVLSDETGNVSFDPIEYDIENRPDAEIRSRLKDIEDIKSIRADLSRHVL